MRVRPVVTLTLAVLLIGACGSTAKSATTEKPTTTTKTATKAATKAASATPAPSTPVTDLNGHQIVGVKAQDVVAEAVADKPLDRATHALLAQQLLAARAVAMRYPTVADATAAGYHLVGGGFGPGSGAHYIGGGFSFNFDPSHPLALIYDGVHATSQMVGLMYYGMGNTAPQGFAGPNDHWHRHSGVCLGNGGDVLFPPDSDVTARKCAIARGSYMAITGWMVHAWVVPGWESPKGVFSHENPDLPCADGTFHTDAIGRCQGS
jgi:hypothetical protein